MKTVWTEHLKDQEEIEKFKKSVVHSKWVLEHLRTILNKLQEGLEKQERSPRTYDKPNWEYRQAHCNGYLQALVDIQNLINLDQKETDDQSRQSTN